jgi:hypothetical protein
MSRWRKDWRSIYHGEVAIFRNEIRSYYDKCILDLAQGFLARHFLRLAKFGSLDARRESRHIYGCSETKLSKMSV